MLPDFSTHMHYQKTLLVFLYEAHPLADQWAACREARHRFPNASILGFYREDSGVHANPSDRVVLKEGDWLFGLCQDQKSFKPNKKVLPLPPPGRICCGLKMFYDHCIVDTVGLDKCMLWNNLGTQTGCLRAVYITAVLSLRKGMQPCGC